ncbi:MAG: hypothetical protein ABUR63_04285, partial [Verrucomicrobiota bacterium]
MVVLVDAGDGGGAGSAAVPGIAWPAGGFSGSPALSVTGGGGGSACAIAAGGTAGDGAEGDGAPPVAAATAPATGASAPVAGKSAAGGGSALVLAVAAPPAASPEPAALPAVAAELDAAGAFLPGELVGGAVACPGALEAAGAVDAPRGSSGASPPPHVFTEIPTTRIAATPIPMAIPVRRDRGGVGASTSGAAGESTVGARGMGTGGGTTGPTGGGGAIPARCADAATASATHVDDLRGVAGGCSNTP